jgi:hypothetical protein
MKGTGGRGTGAASGAGGRGTGGSDLDGGQNGADGGPGDSGSSSGDAGGRGAGGGGGVGAGGASSGGSGTGGGSAGGAGGGPGITHPNCAAWKAAGMNIDGVRTVDPDDTGPIKPFQVYCTGMSTASPARDYLELPRNEDNGWPGKNVSTFAKVGNDNCACASSLTSHFTRVLMRTGDLTLLSADRTFAVFDSDPACYVSDTICDGEKIGFGDAEDCRGIGAAGTANIDLGGTVFHISSAATFAEHGYTGNGTATVSNDRKQANLTGGGYCGGYGPANGELTLEQD